MSAAWGHCGVAASLRNPNMQRRVDLALLPISDRQVRSVRISCTTEGSWSRDGAVRTIDPELSQSNRSRRLSRYPLLFFLALSSSSAPPPISRV